MTDGSETRNQTASGLEIIEKQTKITRERDAEKLKELVRVERRVRFSGLKV